MSEDYLDKLFGSAQFKEQVEEAAEKRRKEINVGYVKYNRKAGIDRWRKAHPERVKAGDAVKVALRKGTLVRGTCLIANDDCRGQIEAHHYKGYAKEHWLDVVWLCKYHHELADSKK